LRFLPLTRRPSPCLVLRGSDPYMYLAGHGNMGSGIGRGMETTVANGSQQLQDRAEANFKKEQRARDGAKAMAEYEAGIIATREKTARLRALRLAKEAADRKLEAEKEAPSEADKKKPSLRAPTTPNKGRRR
jgi:hypothetical protein